MIRFGSGRHGGLHTMTGPRAGAVSTAPRTRRAPETILKNRLYPGHEEGKSASAEHAAPRAGKQPHASPPRRLQRQGVIHGQRRVIAEAFVLVYRGRRGGAGQRRGGEVV